MIGLNPLTDALLLQSLKGASAPAGERGTTPVGNAENGQVIREAQSDSKLNDRPFHQGLSRSGLAASRAYSASSSTITTFNETARVIADIMIKYPQVEARLLILPLLMNQIGKPGVFASHLEKLISFSGLFYESHLASWFRGEYPESLLKNEPQANLFRAVEQRHQAFNDVPGLKIRGPEDRMQYMIRQQLELLDSPNLHLAGQILNGLPIQLWVQQVVLPVDIDEEGASIKLRGPKASGWRLLVRLEHPSFDYADFSIDLVEQNLSIRMTGNSLVLQEYFRRDYDRLTASLSDLRFEKITFHRKLLSRLEVRPDFKLLISSGSMMQSSSGATPFESEYGQQAEHIFLQAQPKGLTSHKSHEMLGLLMNLDMDRKIPRSLYSVIEILTYWVISQINYLPR
jgi:hypothetical protein